MSADPLFTQMVALAFMLVACAAAIAALTARTLFAMCVSAAATAACAAATALALSAPDAALALALLGAGVAPVFLLAGLLLSARASKRFNRAPVLLALAAALTMGAPLMMAAPGLMQSGPAPAPSAGVGLWLAALMFCAALAALGLLGFGERGALSRRDLRS